MVKDINKNINRNGICTNEEKIKDEEKGKLMENVARNHAT